MCSVGRSHLKAKLPFFAVRILSDEIIYLTFYNIAGKTARYFRQITKVSEKLNKNNYQKKGQFFVRSAKIY